MQAYYQMPGVHAGNVVFLCEDDLWTVSLKGGPAHRLSANLEQIRKPLLSPDGKWIAYMGMEERVLDIYVMPAEGGEAIRLTWQGCSCYPVCWKDDKIIYASTAGSFTPRELYLWTVGLDGMPPVRLNYGPARAISFGKQGVILGRNTSDPARWKRYRGGTAGYFLIDTQGRGIFRRFLDLNSNLSCPMWIGDRIYFISDHEGIGNIYSANLKAKDIRKHSSHGDYYARNASTDGKTIVWQAGGDLYSLDIAGNKVSKLNIDFRSPRVQLYRKFVDPAKYLTGLDLSPDAGSVCMDIRGKAFCGGAWEGSIQQYGKKHGVRYYCSRILPQNKGLLTVSDEGDVEHFELYSLRAYFGSPDPKAKPRCYKGDFGRPYDYEPSPCGNWIAFSNHRNELCILNLESEELIKADQNRFGLIEGYSWSPDSRWIAYSCQDNRLTSCIRIFDLQKRETHTVTKPVKYDLEPCFDPEGKYLYFVSSRTFQPIADSMQFSFSFIKDRKPYLITLQKDIRSPLNPDPKALEPKPDKKNDKKTDKTKAKVKPVEIDFDGITERLEEFPVEAMYMGGIAAIPNKIFYYKYDYTKTREDNQETKVDIYCYDLQMLEEQLFVAGVNSYCFNIDRSAILIWSNKQARIISTKRDPKCELPKETKPGRATGWIDLNRFKVEIEPLAEWQQMFREGWRLQKYYFWNETMSNIDWDKVYKRYYPLVERVGCRSEFSDLMWEMQGELGTSHCYEFGGDYRIGPSYPLGKLAVDWSFDSKKQQWKIERIIKGDFWISRNRSPLMELGINIPAGSIVKEINGIPLSAGQTPERCLVNYVGTKVQLTVSDARGRNTRVITVTPIAHEFGVRYRDWVEANREYVHKKSKGKVGYIHIPDMSFSGLQEFHRYFLSELDYDGLVVDVRYNGGGSVSPLLLEKLARKRIGYDCTRWFGPEPYPKEAPGGSLVCLTNEAAGSDGDIFSHAFKLMKLGKLIGKRTWGGVIGIWPRNWLVDGTITTQPEFSFWFKDVGWGVENYGTDPDIEVDILPQDYAQGKDPQLDTAIKVVQEDLRKNPPLKPDFSNKPDLGTK